VVAIAADASVLPDLLVDAFLVVVVVSFVFPCPFNFNLNYNLTKIVYKHIKLTIIWWFPVWSIAIFTIDSQSHFTSLIIYIK
jgi:hypothetical protein